MSASLSILEGSMNLTPLCTCLLYEYLFTPQLFFILIDTIAFFPLQPSWIIISSIGTKRYFTISLTVGNSTFAYGFYLIIIQYCILYYSWIKYSTTTSKLTYKRTEDILFYQCQYFNI